MGYGYAAVLAFIRIGVVLLETVDVFGFVCLRCSVPKLLLLLLLSERKRI